SAVDGSVIHIPAGSFSYNPQNFTLTIDLGSGYQGLTPSSSGTGRAPGYWVQPANYATWPSSYTPASSVDARFGVTEEAGLTLVGALQRTGMGLSALAREGVAALLNAATPNGAYAYSVANVIAMVKAAYANPSLIDSTTALFEVQNQGGASFA